MIKKEGARLTVSGNLTIETVGQILASAVPLLTEGQWEFDLAEVQVTDSSAVSLLLNLQRNAQQHGAQLSLVNVPDNLRSLANLYGVADILALQHTNDTTQ